MATPSQRPTNDLPESYAFDVRPQPRTQTLDSGAPKDRFRDIASTFIGAKEGTYKHQPIKYNSEIRILRIHHGKPTDRIQCMLFPSALVSQSSGQDRATTPGTSKYWALSYWWGEPDEKPRNRIHIYYDTGARGDAQQLNPFNRYGTFYIRDNLKSALVRFRHEEKDVNVWVDALCINQDDKIEKNAQVARMHEVYTQAEMVCIWLGEGHEQTPETFKFLQRILNLQDLDTLVSDPIPTARKWALVIRLMTNRWFSRRWIIQELALSRNATVRWGNEELRWSDFADAIALFMTKYEDIKRTSLDPTDHHKDTDARALGANTIVHATINLFRKSLEGRVEQRLIPLEILVSSLLLAFEATEPRDTIFAVLTLAKDSQVTSIEPNAKEDPRISPDYEKCLLDVYTDFMDYCIEKSQSLDIICRYWAPVPKPPSPEDALKGRSTTATPEIMPSWIPLIENSAFGEPHSLVEGRVNGDSFVGGPERKGQQVYDASAGLHAWHHFGMIGVDPPKRKPPKRSRTFPNFRNTTGPSNSAGSLTPISQAIQTPTTSDSTDVAGPSTEKPLLKQPKYDGSLFLEGFCLDYVSKVSQRVAAKGIIMDDALEMGGWDHKWKRKHPNNEHQPVPDKLWRTLVADRGPNGTSAPGWYRRACLECLQHTDRRGDLNIDELKNTANTPSTQVTFLERVQPIVWGRRFFETRGRTRNQDSLFGLGNPDIREGDLVCIIFGCSVPVLLREIKTGKDIEYTFIGECYVHGMMDGEAVSGKFGTKPPKHPYLHHKEVTLYKLV